MTQNGENAICTIDYYERRANEFARDTANADVSGILREFTALLPANATVLDWGCGTGRDSKHMSDMGLSVVSTDASPAMCNQARELFGIDARCEGFADLSEESEYDGIWACASLLHVGKYDLPAVLHKACLALKPQGVIYVSFKYGNYEGMRKGRWFTDLDEEALATLLQPEFDVIRMWVTNDVRPGRAGEKWLNCLSRKRS